MYNVFIEGKEKEVRVYNDGLLIIEGENIREVQEIASILLDGNNDVWEVELLNNILYTINNNLSTMEVA